MRSNGTQSPCRGNKTKRKKPQREGFRPTAAMVRFLRIELDLLAKRRPYTQKQVAEVASVSESQASRWHDVDGYDSWVEDELRRVRIRLFSRAAVSASHRVIMTGDPKELEILGRVLGLLGSPPEEVRASDASTHTVINLLCPRPEVPQGAIAASAMPLRLPPPNLPESSGQVAVTQLYARK